MRTILVIGSVLSTMCEELLGKVRKDERITDIELQSACTREGLESHLLMAEVDRQEAETTRELIPLTCHPHKLEAMLEANHDKLEVEFIPRLQLLMPGTGLPRVVGVIYRECLIEEERPE